MGHLRLEINVSLGIEVVLGSDEPEFQSLVRIDDEGLKSAHWRGACADGQACQIDAWL